MQLHVPNGIGHFDVAGPDEIALQRFYAGTFGWTVDAKGPGYALVETPKGSANGAISEAEQASLTIGIVVSDLDASLASAQRLGGRVVMPVTDNGWVKKAVIGDPAGNRMTVIQA
jgi:predicted enzyme related to lactoylglutathione lyase